jgi:TPR repeat protein
MQHIRAPGLIACCLLLALAACDGAQKTANRMRAGDTQAAQNPSSNANGPGMQELMLARRFYGEADHAQALQHFIAAAEQGNADAQYYAGVMFADGQGTQRNFEEAAKWYEKAAAQNHADAAYALARLYVFGNGVEPDANKAVELFGRAAQAYGPGEDRARAEQQRLALLSVLEETQQEPAPEQESKGEQSKPAGQAVKEAERP